MEFFLKAGAVVFIIRGIKAFFKKILVYARLLKWRTLILRTKVCQPTKGFIRHIALRIVSLILEGFVDNPSGAKINTRRFNKIKN